MNNKQIEKIELLLTLVRMKNEVKEAVRLLCSDSNIGVREASRMAGVSSATSVSLAMKRLTEINETINKLHAYKKVEIQRLKIKQNEDENTNQTS
ncbi:hypothetical protein ACUVJI_23010 (plasmid) [Vibrio parahaemolyticus]|uniref:hypothetical protein n=1 Tax=Vibrio parahaemolyticus TaxID=670 RepID=UPI0028950F6A|nr:hypothetical protein [Vibrio vulnificus]HCE3031575.1 hypothetical protein [Vibrio parahaemolyticus]HCE4626685.1 hypothetical protein [Vibrio parahaemolyticus]